MKLYLTSIDMFAGVFLLCYVYCLFSLRIYPVVNLKSCEVVHERQALAGPVSAQPRNGTGPPHIRSIATEHCGRVTHSLLTSRRLPLFPRSFAWYVSSPSWSMNECKTDLRSTPRAPLPPMPTLLDTPLSLRTTTTTTMRVVDDESL